MTWIVWGDLRNLHMHVMPNLHDFASTLASRPLPPGLQNLCGRSGRTWPPPCQDFAGHRPRFPIAWQGFAWCLLLTHHLQQGTVWCRPSLHIPVDQRMRLPGKTATADAASWEGNAGFMTSFKNLQSANQ